MTARQSKQWQEMVKQSWSPRQWFDGDDSPRLGESQEDTIMWVYRKLEGADTYEVGHYSPNGEWCQESEHPSRPLAAQRVHWLNGGNH